jgi:prepilin signal peptidase PulO-like enzyme (type II secretory pathway)
MLFAFAYVPLALIEMMCSATLPATALPVLACLGVSAVTDIEAGYIYNDVLFAAGILALAAATICATIADAAIGCFACGGTMLALRVVSGGRLGLGDVKLACLIGTIGPSTGIVALGMAFVSGSIAVGCGRALGMPIRNRYLPFAPYLAVGTWGSLMFGGSR